MGKSDKSIHTLVTQLINSQKMGLLILVFVDFIVIFGLFQDIRTYLANNTRTWTTFFSNQLSKYAHYSDSMIIGRGEANSYLLVDSSGEIINSDNSSLIGINIKNSPLFSRASQLKNNEELILIDNGIIESRLMSFYIRRKGSDLSIMTFFPGNFFPVLSYNTVFIVTDDLDNIYYSTNSNLLGSSFTTFPFYIYRGRVYIASEVDIRESGMDNLFILHDTTIQLIIFFIILIVTIFFLYYNRTRYNRLRNNLNCLDQESREIETLTNKLTILDSINSMGVDYNLHDQKEILINFIYHATAKEVNFVENRNKLDTIKNLSESVLTLLNKFENIISRLNETKNKYQSIYENTQEGIFQATTEGIIINANNPLAQTLGFSTYQEMILKISKRTYEPFTYRDHKKCFFASINSSGVVKHFETIFNKADGGTVPVVISGVGIKDDSGNIFYAQGSVRDLTSEQVAKKLVEEKEKAEAIAQTKSVFFANVSHELRTPLNAVIGFSELLGLKLKDEELKEYTDSILIAGKSLLTLITDVLDLSKIEANRMDIVKRPVSIRDILYEVSQIFGVTAHRKGIEIGVNCDELPQRFILDESRVRQILINLVGNSIKFTDRGYIHIRAYLDDRTLIIEVEDSGRGIPEELQGEVFNEFKQVGDQRGITGSGLGLSICKRLVGLMDGDIELSSEVNHGSTFRVRLFNIEIDTAYRGQREESSENNLNLMFDSQNILIIDDTEQIRDYIQKALSMTNLNVISADGGKAGLAILEKIVPDLILLDIKMPDLDGYEVCKKIREDFKDIPIVAFTASVEDDREAIMRNGFNDVLNKPIPLNDLIGVISKYLFFTSIVNDEKDSREIIDLNLSDASVEGLRESFPTGRSRGKVIKTKDVDIIISILQENSDLVLAGRIEELKNRFNIEELGALLDEIWEINRV